MKTVLSIDGGGIRGIIPALVLQEIESYTKKNISELFDLIVGTSTGGILALGLVKKDDSTGASQYTATELAKLYEEHRYKIFQKDGNSSRWSKLRKEQYSYKGLEDVLKLYFEDAVLSDSLTNVVITSYDIEKRIPWFFKHVVLNGEVLHNRDRNVLMRDVARATSAAPTYFSPKEIEGDFDNLALIDGGVYANNPAMCAYVEAKSMYPDEQILLVSLGTGEQTKPIWYKDAENWGQFKWGKVILDIVFDGVSKTVDSQLKKLSLSLNNVGLTYYRFQSELAYADDELDSVSDNNVKNLKRTARNIMLKEEKEIRKLCWQLMENLDEKNIK